LLLWAHMYLHTWLSAAEVMLWWIKFSIYHRSVVMSENRVLYLCRCPNALQTPVHHDSYPIAQRFSLFHGMRWKLKG
jgi:hypothetical protein